jgi:hypothetical protein
MVLTTREGATDFPETLVVWRGDVAAVDPRGRPRWRELAIYCPNPSAPNELLEITTSDATAVPGLADVSAWSSAIAAIKASGQGRIVLTNRMRTAALPGGTSRGAVRFAVRQRPSAEQWAQYREGDIAWADLAWPHCSPGSQFGMRQTWCAIELQMQTGDTAAQASSPETSVAFFGSAALYWPLKR